MPDRRRDRGPPTETTRVTDAVVGAWRRLGRGWRAVVLGLAIVCTHLLVQTV